MEVSQVNQDGCTLKDVNTMDGEITFDDDGEIDGEGYVMWEQVGYIQISKQKSI